MSLTIKRIIGMIAALILVVGGIFAYKFHKIHQLQERMAGAKFPPTTVSTIIAARSVWQRRLHSVGSLVAIQGVTVSSQLAGAVAKIAFESGRHVKRGDLLVQLDISTDLALLHGFEAQADLARITLARARELRASNTNSQADLDSALALEKQAGAALENQRAIIAQKTVRAPFSGLLGIRQVDLGQYLPAGGAIVILQALDPIYVNFSLPQQDINNLHVGQTVQVGIDAFPGVRFPGAISAVNSRVDDVTRNLEVQATLFNSGERLLPGMFAEVEVVLPAKDSFITLPETAIVYNPYGDAVYIVEKTADESGLETLVARQHFVTLGDTRGDQVAVLKGVDAGDMVVTAGQIKLRNGSPVQVNNAVTPSNNPAPTPPNT